MLEEGYNNGKKSIRSSKEGSEVYRCFPGSARLDTISKKYKPPLTGGLNVYWSERHDSNVRPLPPQGSALAKLSYAPTDKYHSNHFHRRSQAGATTLAPL